MKINLYQVDAFSNKALAGNPAAVMPLMEWLPIETLQAIAAENNLSETAFIKGGMGSYEIRWFTPLAEIDLCGHATLASAFIVFTVLEKDLNKVVFRSLKSGDLVVERSGDLLTMNFPSRDFQPISDFEPFTDALGARPLAVYSGKDIMVVFEDEDQVRELKPDQAKVQKLANHGLVVTAPGKSSDFVSRAFFPALGIPEDPVTGATHTMLTPYWAERLGKSQLNAKQLSKRGGELELSLEGNRVLISGQATLYLSGEVTI